VRSATTFAAGDKAAKRASRSPPPVGRAAQRIIATGPTTGNKCTHPSDGKKPRKNEMELSVFFRDSDLLAFYCAKKRFEENE